MLKYIKSHMSTIDGIEIFPIIGLAIFMVFFTGLLIYVYKSDKSMIEEISNYPIDDNNKKK